MTMAGMRMTLSQQFYDRFWRLAQYAYRAETARNEGDHCMGISSALQATLQDAITFDHATCVRLVSARRESIAPEMPNTDDPYYRGYLWGCDKAISIMRGGE